MVLGARREPEPGSDPISGPFRQIADKIEAVDIIVNEGAIRAVLGLLAECGIRLYVRETSGDRELFLVAPADAFVPISRVPDLLRLAQPRFLTPKRLPGNLKIGRLARLHPPIEAATDAPPANPPNKVKR